MNPREILLYGPIGSDGVTAAALATTLQQLGSGPVTLRINSPGGDAFDGLAMNALVRQHGEVTAIVDGLCASAATFVAFGAKRVVMAKEAVLMLHAPSSAISGNSEQLREQADFLDKVSERIANIYAKRSGKSVAEVAGWVNGETWFNSDEALAAGLVDEVIDSRVVTFAHAWRFASAPEAIAAKLDPLTSLRADNARLASELATAKAEATAARLDGELAGVEVTDEQRAALVKTFATDPAGAKALIAKFRSSAHVATVIVASDAAQRAAQAADASDPYARHMARISSLRHQ